MKKICFLLGVFGCVSGSSDVHLWEEDPHFIYYRVLMLERNLYAAKDCLKEIDSNGFEDKIAKCLEHLDEMERILRGNPLVKEKF